MTNNIVNLSVTQTVAAAPNTLQKTAAFISQGGTNAAANSLTLLTQASSLTSILATPLALSAMVWAGGTVTATASVAHGLTVSQVYNLTISGALPAGYNGTYACSITSTTQFTFTLASNPGTATSYGTWVSSTQGELQQMTNTWFGQGSNNAVYVLELGLGSVNAGVATLTTWISNNLKTVYAFLVPREWDNNTAFLALIPLYASPTSLLYFWVTTTISTYTSYPATFKNVISWVEAPSIPLTEFTAAAALWVTINYTPSSTNKVPPFAFAYVYGVTPYPTTGNQTLFANLKSNGVNWIAKGTEGGITNTMVQWGSTEDGNPFNYWYSVDWVQLNEDLQISNAVINGSNNPQNPLYLNQQGINTLQAVAASVLSSAVTFGLLLGNVVQSELNGPSYATALASGTFAGQAVINAVPFAAYYTASPSDYATGTYNGLTCTITPLRGFLSITFGINVTSIVAPLGS